MPQFINTNIMSLNTVRVLDQSQGSLQTSMERLSSGKRINSARDDAAGMAISEGMTSQIKGMNQAVRNANDAASLMQTAEGAMQESSNILQRIRELAVQSTNDTNTASDRVALQKEVTQLQEELNRISNSTQFNGKNLLDGTFTTQKFQIGSNSGDTISLSIGSSAASAIGNNTASTAGTAMGVAVAATADEQGTSTSVVAGQALTVGGSEGSQNITVTAKDSAKTIATSVNAQTANTGVTAEATTKAQLHSLGAAGTVSFSLYGTNSSTAASVSVNVAATSDLSGVAEAINTHSGSTGITATWDQASNKVTMTHSGGEDIIINDFNNTAATKTIDFAGVNAAGTASTDIVLTGAAATDSSRVTGYVEFTSNSSYTVATDTGTTVLASASVSSSLSAVGSATVSTQSGAASAIKTIDGALSYINSERAKLGAIQNRLTSTVSNMSNTSQNLSAAKSRVLDADFAAETANLSKNQILQQAGMAMLSQANQLPQNVLKLLQ